AAFVASTVYYIVLGNTWLELRGIDPSTVSMTPQIWQIVGQFVRNLVVAFVFAYFVMRLEIVDWKGALRLGLWVWVGFQAMQIAGSVLHEGYPLELYAIHVGDALLQTLLMSFILGVWAGKKGKQK
ncbi:MAG TPA: DUF1761 domain-containing protein, partial [Roseiflexaceae bacterium]